MAWKTEKSDYEKGTVLYSTKKIHGKDITFCCDGQHPFLGFRIFGKTEQKNTEGIQLLDINNLEIGKAWNNSANAARAVIPVICNPNTQYTLSITGGSFDGVYWVEKESAESNSSLINSQTTAFPYSRTTTGTTGVIFLQFNKANISEVDFDGVEIMLNAGSSALPWEPYTGGIPSPNPDYTQEMVRVGGNGSINVSVTDGADGNMQSISICAPNGLPGVLVTKESLANYIDESGKMWCCDEIDLERGVYVQRIHREVFDGSRTYFKSSATNRNGIAFACKFFEYVKTYVGGMCNNRRFYKGDTAVINSIKTYEFCIYGSPYVYAGFCSSTATTIEEFTAEMDANPAIILCILETPIETPLTDDDIATYRSLYSNHPATTVFNDSGAWMEIEYPVNVMQKPKTDWKWISEEAGDYFNVEDYNRIIGNIQFLHEFSAKLNTEFDIVYLPCKMSYSDYIYADEFNAIEDNLVAIGKGTYPYVSFDGKKYYPNQVTPNYTDFNRMESLMLERYKYLISQDKGRRGLSFVLGGSEF